MANRASMGVPKSIEACVNATGLPMLFPDQLQTALHKLQGRFRIRVRDLIHWDIKDYEKFTDSYNREARRIGARQCPEGYIWSSPPSRLRIKRLA
jgi:hypothetical protein